MPLDKNTDITFPQKIYEIPERCAILFNLFCNVIFQNWRIIHVDFLKIFRYFSKYDMNFMYFGNLATLHALVTESKTNKPDH